MKTTCTIGIVIETVCGDIVCFVLSEKIARLWHLYASPFSVREGAKKKNIVEFSTKGRVP